MTDALMLIPPGWGSVAALALRHGRPDVLNKLCEMDLDLAEEIYREQYGEPIEDVEGIGLCWVHQPDQWDHYEDDEDPDAPRYYECSREACEVRTRHPSAFYGFDPPVPGSPADDDYPPGRSWAIAAGLMRADLERLADLEREGGGPASHSRPPPPRKAPRIMPVQQPQEVTSMSETTTSTARHRNHAVPAQISPPPPSPATRPDLIHPEPPLNPTVEVGGLRIRHMGSEEPPPLHTGRGGQYQELLDVLRSRSGWWDLGLLRPSVGDSLRKGGATITRRRSDQPGLARTYAKVEPAGTPKPKR